MHEKVDAYERWSFTGKINKISPKLNLLTFYINLLLAKIMEIDKATAIKTIQYSILVFATRFLCFVHILMNSTVLHLNLAMNSLL